MSQSFTKKNVQNITGDVVQIVNYQTGAYATSSATIPYDDTIPQNTEGFEVMTCAVTPTSATNKLKIDVVVLVGVTGGAIEIAALFQDSTANALACGYTWQSAGNAPSNICFTHYMTAGTTSATTFKVRLGALGPTYFNGNSGGRSFGGVSASSITITEIQS